MAKGGDTIDERELKGILEKLGHNWSDERVRGLLLALDEDGDGKVQATDLARAIEVLQRAYSTMMTKESGGDGGSGAKHVKPSGSHRNAPPCGPLLVCSESGADFAKQLHPHLGGSWELVAATVPEEERLAGAQSVVVLLSEGGLDAPEIVLAMRCALAYGTPRTLVHAAESCAFGAVWPRADPEFADVMPLYDKIAITLIGEYVKDAAKKIVESLEEQQQAVAETSEANVTETKVSGSNEATAARSDEELAQMQAELLHGAPPLLKALGIAFSVFLSHRRATGQGPVGRIYMALKEDYRCFLDSEVMFKLHNLR